MIERGVARNLLLNCFVKKEKNQPIGLFHENSAYL